MTSHRLPHTDDTVIELTEKGLTVSEIASFLDCAESTIYRNFASALKQGRVLRDSSLRKKQMEVALSGNPSMLIWLGKQLLDQRDKSEVDATVKYEHLDLSAIPEDKLRTIASLVESAYESAGRPAE